MSDYVIVTDSTCDLPQEMADEMNIKVVRLHVLLDGKSYENYLDGRELSFPDMYNAMRNKKLPTTSQATYQGFLECFEPILNEGKDILYVGFSGAMSGTYQAGCLCANDMLEKYPDRKILTVDSLAASSGEGLLVYLCAKKKEEGLSLEEVQMYGKENALHMCHTFTVADLMHIMRGGRASKGSAIIGTIIGIKPILRINEEGLIEAYDKIRGRKRAISKVIETFKENVTDLDTPVFVSHGDCEEEALDMARRLKEEVGIKNVIINYVGAVCGCHGGPDILAIFYHGKKR
ncbi:MAG: DegV family protein [Lachnospiraceae bacterium]|nr:DegV family protein [Lachnospiraceae bacterium]